MRISLASNVLFTLALVALSAPALAVDRRVPQQFGTIQEAVDNANDGDRIVVTRGVYSEHVVANADGLKFIGRGRVVWDGNPNGTVGKQLTVRGNDTLVQGFRFRHGEWQVDLIGNNTVVRRCTSIGAEENFVSVYGARNDEDPDSSFSSISDGEFKATSARVELCRVDGSFGAAVRVHSDNALVRRNRFTRMTSKAAFVFGDDALVERNVVNTSYVFGLHVVGDDMRVQRNNLMNVRIKAIGTSGDDSMILNNRISRVGVIAGIMWEEDDDETHDDVSSSRYDPSQTPSVAGPTIAGNRIVHGGQIGIRCYDDNVSTGGSVTRNVIANGTTDGIETDVPGMAFTNNRIVNVGRLGVLIEADDCTLVGNRVTNSGSAMGTPAFYIEGSDVTVQRCFATNVSGDGFHVDADEDNVAFEDCVARNCSEDGFDIESSSNNDNSLQRCRAFNCDGEGLDNSGTDTDVTSCVFKGNRINVANAGTFDTYSGNNVPESAVGDTDEVDTSTDSSADDVED